MNRVIQKWHRLGESYGGVKAILKDGVSSFLSEKNMAVCDLTTSGKPDHSDILKSKLGFL